MIVSGRVLATSIEGLVLADGVRQIKVATSATDAQPGDLVRVEATAGTGETMVATKVEVVFRPLRPPFTPGTETHAFLAEGLLARMQMRGRVTAAVRAHFASVQSLEIETPTVATSPGLDLHLHAFEVARPFVMHRDPDESGRRPSIPPLATPYAYLVTSPEYHMKRLLAGGVRRCHQFARCFRVDEDGARHEPEFTMLEWYRAWDDMDAMLADTIAVVRAAAGVTDTPDVVTVRGSRVRLDDGVERLTVREAFARWAPEVSDPIALANRDEEAYFEMLVDRIEPHLGVERPCFLTHFAARHASLAQLTPGDSTVCDRFELYLNGTELSNGFVELTDPPAQRARLERDQRERESRGLTVYPIDERFLAALEEGMPPSAGNALGFDRLVAMVLGRDRIADVIAFPSRRR